MKKHVQIKDSYNVWNKFMMMKLIYAKVEGIPDPEWFYKNANSLAIEWWLHNIGYWVTRPFISIPAIGKLNLRFKHVDLMIKVGAT